MIKKVEIYFFLNLTLTLNDSKEDNIIIGGYFNEVQSIEDRKSKSKSKLKVTYGLGNLKKV